ncbi:MAG: hypothetical protein A3I63_04020 [Betaproteobacteria bacterium RIFCSPLOWO2_02_FULL_66_14]|nr:MAG: hypothetical protein A3I63_04020 [Betaproteobacteria bacterium RIFCSPLOWO2_02_FULL_66_14]
MRELTFASAIHLAAVLPAVVLGAAQMLRPKGTRSHVALGRAWVAALGIAAVSSFWITGISSGGRFSVIHLLSIFVLFNLAAAIWFVRRGNVSAHRKFMIGTVLGLMGAGAGALAPGRFLHQLLF